MQEFPLISCLNMNIYEAAAMRKVQIFYERFILLYKGF